MGAILSILVVIVIVVITISLVMSLRYLKPIEYPKKTSISSLKNCESYGIAAEPPPLWTPDLQGAIPCPQGTEYYPFTKLCHYKCPNGYNRIGSCECQLIKDSY